MKWIREKIESLKKYKKFAKEIGYNDWEELIDNTFMVFELSEDDQWFISHIPNNKWAAWSDQGEVPFEIIIFGSWEEAIKYSRKIFEESHLPEENWYPEGFDIEDDVYSNPPDINKKFDVIP